MSKQRHVGFLSVWSTSFAPIVAGARGEWVPVNSFSGLLIIFRELTENPAPWLRLPDPAPRSEKETTGGTSMKKTVSFEPHQHTHARAPYACTCILLCHGSDD
jgi:hypothetical protein